MNEKPNARSEELALFRRLADDQLSAEEFAQLQERLLADAEFRQRCVRHLDLEACLYEELATPSAANAAVQPRAAITLSWRAVWVLGASMVGLAAAALLAVTIWPRGGGPRPSAEYVEAQLRGLEVAAIVTHVEGLLAIKGQLPLKPGMRLKPGTLMVQKGQVQLEFLGGAKLVVAGPAELHILSPKSATLVSGQAATRVLAWGKGFVLKTPEAVMVDLGTEFAVGVDERQGSEMHVVDGEVEVSVLGEDGSTLTSELVEEKGGLRIRPGAQTLEPNSRSRLKTLTILDDVAPPLNVTADYVAAIRAAQPAVYWRCESLAGGQIANEMGPQFAARLPTGTSATAFQIADGHLCFSKAAGPRHLLSEPLAGLNAESFSVELWVNPAMLHWATLVGVVPNGDEKARVHLNVLEIAHQTTMVHQAGAFRFMHRHPPKGRGGMNLFTAQGCTPGQWHHLVAVKTPHDIKLYVNGQLDRRLEGNMGSDATEYQLLLGELRSGERQFEGSLDEIAVYLKELSPTEIEQHYKLLGR